MSAIIVTTSFLFPYHGRCGGQLISGPVALRRLVRSEPLHPHIMGDVICAWFGKKTVGRVVAWFTKSTDDDDDDDDDDIHDNQIGVGEGRQRQWTATITTTTGRAGIRAFGDVFSLCRGMLLQHKQIMNIFYIIWWTATNRWGHTYNNQPKTAAIIKDRIVTPTKDGLDEEGYGDGDDFYY